MTWSNLLERSHQGCCCGGKVRLSHHSGPKAERVFESGSWWAGDPLGQYKEVVFTLPVLPLGPGVPSLLSPGIPFSPLGPGTPSHRQEISVTSLRSVFHPQLRLPSGSLDAGLTAFGNTEKLSISLNSTWGPTLFFQVTSCPRLTGLQPALICKWRFFTEKFIALELVHWPEHEVHSHVLPMDQTNHKAEPSLPPVAAKSEVMFSHEIAHKTAIS